MSDVGPQWITTTEAAQRLGVKRATLYAYVSRGLLSSVRRPGQQQSLFDRSQIDELATASRPAGSAQQVMRFRGVATAVSSQVDGDLLYRGVPLAQVVDSMGFDEAARLVLGDPTAVQPGTPRTGGARARPGRSGTARARGSELSGILAALPLERRLPVAVHLLAAADPLAADTDPDHVRAAAPGFVRAAVAALAGVEDGEVPHLLLRALGGRHEGTADARLLQVVLVTLLDHGLTASTIAARVAASTRAGLADGLAAAYAAMAGPLHGAAPIAARSLLDDPRSPAEAVAAALRAHGHVPGFGHFLYPDGDPRADVVLDALWRRRGTTRLRARVEGLAAVVAERSGALPNIDLANAAALRALGLPGEAGEVVFQVARSYGVAAHVVEEYGEAPLRWRGREAVG